MQGVIAVPVHLAVAGRRDPRFVASERNAPPEDRRGIPGFGQTLEAAADPNHENHAEAKQWLDDYDLDTIDELPSNTPSAASPLAPTPLAPDSPRSPLTRGAISARSSTDGYADLD